MTDASNSYPKIETDEIIREKVSHVNEKYPFQYYWEDIWAFDFHCIDWHWHPEIEMVYAQNIETIIFFYFFEPRKKRFIIDNRDGCLP